MSPGYGRSRRISLVPARSSPGGRARIYVTWVGIDGFYTKPSDTFSSVFASTIDQVQSFTDKPICWPTPAWRVNANQYANILNLFHGTARYQVLGLVWFDTGDWRLEGNPMAESGVPGERHQTEAGTDSALMRAVCCAAVAGGTA